MDTPRNTETEVELLFHKTLAWGPRLRGKDQARMEARDLWLGSPDLGSVEP